MDNPNPNPNPNPNICVKFKFWDTWLYLTIKLIHDHALIWAFIYFPICQAVRNCQNIYFLFPETALPWSYCTYAICVTIEWITLTLIQLSDQIRTLAFQWIQYHVHTELIQCVKFEFWDTWLYLTIKLAHDHALIWDFIYFPICQAVILLVKIYFLFPETTLPWSSGGPCYEAKEAVPPCIIEKINEVIIMFWY